MEPNHLRTTMTNLMDERNQYILSFTHALRHCNLRPVGLLPDTPEWRTRDGGVNPVAIRLLS